MSYIIGTQKFPGCWDGSWLGEEAVLEVAFNCVNHLPISTPSTEEAPINQHLIDHQSEQRENYFFSVFSY